RLGKIRGSERWQWASIHMPGMLIAAATRAQGPIATNRAIVGATADASVVRTAATPSGFEYAANPAGNDNLVDRLHVARPLGARVFRNVKRVERLFGFRRGRQGGKRQKSPSH